MKFKIKRGLWIVFAFNLLLGLLIFWSGLNYSKAVVESHIYVNTVGQLPDLTIENKTIVKPTDLQTQFLVQISPTDVVAVYVRTDIDYMNGETIQDGIYITRKAISLFSDGEELLQYGLPESGVISSQTISKFLYRCGLLFTSVLSLLVIAIFWLFYLLLVGLAALVSLIPVLRRNLSEGAVWRNTAWAYMLTLVINFIGGFFGYGLPLLLFPFVSEGIVALLLASAFMSISVWRNKKKSQEPKTTEKKKD